MTLKEKFAERLWEEDNQGSWDIWAEADNRVAYLELADDLLNIMSNHFGIR